MICENWLNKRDELMARTTLYIGLIFHGTGVFIHPLIVSPSMATTLISVHLFFITAELLWFFISWRLPKFSIQSYMLPIEITAVLVFGSICSYGYFSPELTVNDKIYGCCSFLTFVGMLTIFIPFHNRMVPLTAAFYLFVSTLFMFSNDGVPLFWLNLIWSVVPAGLGFQWMHISRTRAAAIKELRTRSGMAPLQIVRKSLQNDTSIEIVFKPKLRYCVCISSDWRGFQQLTTRMDVKAIAYSLNSYYEICNDLLPEFFPGGNFYSDWIADELFIVAFTENPLEIMALAESALGYSQKLLAEKEKFSKERDFPFAVDIGISIGQALVGMMGPPQNRKATALGEVPGRSRRLQGTGKLLRYNLGEKDRIIFADDFAETLPDNDIVRSFTLDENRKLRDLECRVLYFVELNHDLFDLALDQVS